MQHKPDIQFDSDLYQLIATVISRNNNRIMATMNVDGQNISFQTDGDVNKKVLMGVVLSVAGIQSLLMSGYNKLDIDDVLSSLIDQVNVEPLSNQ